MQQSSHEILSISLLITNVPILLLYFQGLHRIQMGAKLNEVAASYSWEGWDCFNLPVMGSDCNIILDMFSKLFSPPSKLDLDDLQEPKQKKAHTEVAEFEEEMLKQEGLPDTSKETIL